MVLSWSFPGSRGDGQDEGETGEPNETGEVKPRRRANLRARVLAELAKSSAEEVRERLEGELLEHDRHIAAAQDRVWEVWEVTDLFKRVLVINFEYVQNILPV
jgi:hypothetical protein